MESEAKIMKEFAQADATRIPLADDSVDLVFGSPPYMDARTYGIGAQRGVEEWIEFMLRCTAEAVRVSRGLAIWIVAGVQRDHCYWPGCEGLLYEWWKRGGREWRPAYWHRHGIPGGGGDQGLCPKVELAYFFTKCEKYIPWADNTANGHPPRWAPGGEMSYRLADGARVNQWGKPIRADGRPTGSDGEIETGVPAAVGKRPSHKIITVGSNRRADGTIKKNRRCAHGSKNGDTIQEDAYLPPVLANPGNLIQGIKVGGGHMGHQAAHENEAPFPQKLAEWFIRSWCKPDGLVLDPFSGSGTTVAAACALGRRGLGFDLRLSQAKLAHRRCREIQPMMFES